MTNRLASATSPYLLQHADNPVDWWEWGPEALELARRSDRPILLSVGYAACHWCHVMAHESFSDEQTATYLNTHFVSVKVDREERPDIDAVYMQATQAMTGQGGWPMTVFLTPDGHPFYAGTYFPPTARHGLPAFGQVLEAVAEAWQNRRDEITSSARTISDQLSAVASTALGADPDSIDITAAITQLRADFDESNGGFGRAPKFPPSMIIEALLRDGSSEAAEMAHRTLDAMAAGGIYDQLAGGFARYSVDARWTVPHFEKMLYDNALLLGVYVHAARTTDDRDRRDRYVEVVEQTVRWLESELRTPDGGFAASLDADSPDPDDPHGHTVEGAFYVWTPAELVTALGPEDGGWAAGVFDVTDAGTFEHGRSTLTRRTAVDDHERLGRITDRLRAARAIRPGPGRDDKVVAAWNGWLIASLTEAGRVFDRPAWVELATDAAELIWGVHWTGERLRRTSRDGVAGDAAGVLEDYAALVLAFVRLAEATGDPAWVERAITLAGVMESQFAAEDGGFFDTAADAESLVARPRDPTDNATPSGLSSTVHAYARLGRWTGDDRWTRRAAEALSSAAELIGRAPRFAGWLLAEAIGRQRPPVEVAVVGSVDDPATRELSALAWRCAPSGSVIVTGPPGAAGVPLLADRTMIDNRPTAYVCRHFVCRLPVNDPIALAEQLRAGVPGSGVS